MSKAIHFITIFILMINANAAPTKNMEYLTTFLAAEKICPDTRWSNDPYLIHASMVCMFKKLRLSQTSVKAMLIHSTYDFDSQTAIWYQFSQQLDEKGQYVKPSTRDEEILITFAKNVDDCAREVTPFSPLSKEFPPFHQCVLVAISGLYDIGLSGQN